MLQTESKICFEECCDGKSQNVLLLRILQETEELAQEINDGSLKLFCRMWSSSARLVWKSPMPNQIR